MEMANATFVGIAPMDTMIVVVGMIYHSRNGIARNVLAQFATKKLVKDWRKLIQV